MQPRPTSRDFVIGVGASAGGLKAFKAFLSGIPDTEKFAYVLIQHLSPDYRSELSRLLQPSTRVAVQEIEDGLDVRAGRVYVIPSGMQVRISDGVFRLTQPDDRGGAHSTIDVFLRSIATEYGPRSGCVILSGTGSDGTLGLKHIKEAGGPCLVQDPAEAEYPGMPQAAVNSGMADVVAPVRDLGGSLASYADAEPGIEKPESEKSKPDDGPATARPSSDASHLPTIFTLLHDTVGKDFTGYREGTLMRRIHHRMRLRQFESVEAYVHVLEREGEEVHRLARDFLISVTNFFRDAGAFEELADRVIPELFAGKRRTDTVRVWVAGCATGEEAYSLLMLMEEYRSTCEETPRIQIFASDIDESALEQGRRGFYPPSLTADVSEERLQRFFDVEEGGYRIRANVRDQVIFARHNLLTDPPFVHLDLISCRNLLIYLQRAVQDRVVDLFHYALQPGGYLFLGRSESPHSIRTLFDPVEDATKVFRANPDVEDPYTFPLVPVQPEHRPTDAPPEASGPAIRTIHREEVIRRHLPPSVLVGPNLDVRHLLGDVSRFLRVEPGLPPRALLQMVPPSLRTELRGAMTRALRDGEAGTIQHVRMPANRSGPGHLVDLNVEPVYPENAPLDTYVLVTFHVYPEAEPGREGESVDDSSGGRASPETADGSLRSARNQIRQLQTELESVRHRLHTVTEEYETSTEELLASNEQLEAANEELRATTEELEVSREEIESTNEELLTLNRELQEKVGRLNRMNSDLHNLMETTEIATIFLDGDLCLRQYTESATRLFNVIPTDVGRPFQHVSHRLETDGLLEDVRTVLKDLAPIEREMQSESGEWYKMRSVPYRTLDDRIEGALMTFVDVTDLKAAEQRVEQVNAKLERRVEKRTRELAEANEALQAEAVQHEKARNHFRKLFRLGPVAGIITTLREGRIVDVNQRYLALSGYDRSDLIGETVTGVGLVDETLRTSQVELLLEEGRLHAQEIRLHTEAGGHVDVMFSSELIERDGRPLVLELGVNITARKKAEALMRKARDEAESMNRLKSSFIANMSHEIRTPLTGIIGFADVLAELVNTDESRRYIRYVRANGKRLLETLDSVLDLARLDAQEIRLQPVPVELNGFVEETLALFALRAEDKGLDLREEHPPDPVHVKIDTSLLQRILNNLMDNALKFTTDGHITLRVDGPVEIRDDDRQAVRFSVTDTGPGMSPEFQERLYEEFTQEHGGTDRPKEGAGLGLAITHRLVRLMDGTIVIDSEEGRGTTATVTLPCRPVAGEGPDGPRRRRDDSAPLQLRDGSRPAILVVDDHPEVGTIAGKFLADCRVECVTSAPKAIEAVTQQAFDIVLVDIQLGAEGSGVEVLRAIRSLSAAPNRSRGATADVLDEPPTNGAEHASSGRDGDGEEDAVRRRAVTERSVPVMALTAYSLPGDRQRFLEEGFDAYLGKPFSPRDLRARVRDLLEAE
jgi:two-component system CheB/CheR fusion protein